VRFSQALGRPSQALKGQFQIDGKEATHYTQLYYIVQQYSIECCLDCFEKFEIKRRSLYIR